MTQVKNETRPIQPSVIFIALSIAGLFAGGSFDVCSAQDRNALETMPSSKRMADGKQWTTSNLNVDAERSYCYEDAESNCVRYGRLYTWESAREACQSLGDRWRLPANEDWQRIAKHYGGVRGDSDDDGRAAYGALVTEGGSGFNAVLGGGRSDDGRYARLEAHGFYWTASESDPVSAWFYNFGRGVRSLNRHQGGKKRAFSARCISE